MRGVSSDSLASLAKAIGLHRPHWPHWPHWGVLLTAGTLSKHDGPPLQGAARHVGTHRKPFSVLPPTRARGLTKFSACGNPA